MSNRAARVLAALSIATAAALAALPSRAEFDFAIYFGAAETFKSDVQLIEPGDTNLTFSDVPWEGESFRSPLYYGARFTWWFNRAPQWGVFLDFTHAKMFAELDKTVVVSGTRGGTPVSGTEEVGETFDSLAFSHGHNMVTANMGYRFRIRKPIRPYVGFGLGVALPHVEVDTGGPQTNEYQVAGPTVQALGGVDFTFNKWFSMFAELKTSFSDIDADLESGGTLQTDAWTNHLVIGVSFNFWR
ncbi:MAG: outer membrane beta-barrel protein [Acidobacteriota bacterium]|nr:outer membrane beta-barrel protein [Acidobacteriota bacterium]